MAAKPLLIGDIGGTNARFALVNPERAEFSDAVTLQCADFSSANGAICHYLDELSVDAPDIICLAVAGPVVVDSVKVTNNHWTVNAEEIARDFGTSSVRLLNDFEAVAMSIPQLQAQDLMSIGLPEHKALPEHDFDVAVVGPGTGFGAAGLIRRGRTVVPIVGEGGHIGFAPTSQVQIEVLNVLREKLDRVSLEYLVSGSGIQNLFEALTLIHGKERSRKSAPEIFSDSAESRDPVAVETAQIFFEILGQVAGDFALTFGAKDGVYIAGGITKRYPQLLQQSGFRKAFDDKGKHRDFMERIPTLLITHDEPGLLGAAYCALQPSSA